VAIFGAKRGEIQSGGVGAEAKKEAIERELLRLLQSAQAATMLSISIAFCIDESLAIGIT
jgi:hypothetical protein